MPFDPNVPYGPGIGSPTGPMAGPMGPPGGTPPGLVGNPGRPPMWAGGGMGPGFPPQRPNVPLPGVAGATPGMPAGFTPEILNLIKARMAERQFRPGPENSLLPTGEGGGLAGLRPGGY